MPRHPLGEKAMTDAERQRKRRERLRKERGPAPETDSRAELTKARHEIYNLRQRIHDLKAARDRCESAAKAARTKLAKPTPPPDGEDPRIARLTKANSELRSKLRHMQQFYEEQSRLKGVMPFTTYTRLMRCVHPDQPPPTPAQRQEACALLSQWKQDGDRARRQGR
jgi:hypothetical protein